MTSAISYNSTTSSMAWHLSPQCHQQSQSMEKQQNSISFSTSTIREALCNLKPVEIPRPKFAGFQFVATRGRHGFYQSLKRAEAEKMGINLKAMAPLKRPSLPNEWHAVSEGTTTQLDIEKSTSNDNFRRQLPKVDDLQCKSDYSIPEEPEQYPIRNSNELQAMRRNDNEQDYNNNNVKFYNVMSHDSV